MSDFYRGRFVDLEACARILRRDGSRRRSSRSAAATARWRTARRAFPGCDLRGIDVAPEVGRLLRGNCDRATFTSIDSRSFLDATADRYDLVLVVDVLHHVPKPGASRRPRRCPRADGARRPLRDQGLGALAIAGAPGSVGLRPNRDRRPGRVLRRRRARASWSGAVPRRPRRCSGRRSAPRRNNVLIVYRRATVISVVIPVKDGGSDLVRCLDGDRGAGGGRRGRGRRRRLRLDRRQRRAGALARRRVHEIAAGSSTTARTRNLGAELARGRRSSSRARTP